MLLLLQTTCVSAHTHTRAKRTLTRTRGRFLVSCAQPLPLCCGFCCCCCCRCCDVCDQRLRSECASARDDDDDDDDGGGGGWVQEGELLWPKGPAPRLCCDEARCPTCAFMRCLVCCAPGSAAAPAAAVVNLARMRAKTDPAAGGDGPRCWRPAATCSDTVRSVRGRFRWRGFPPSRSPCLACMGAAHARHARMDDTLLLIPKSDIIIAMIILHYVEALFPLALHRDSATPSGFRDWHL